MDGAEVCAATRFRVDSALKELEIALTAVSAGAKEGIEG
jgi:hypothetical protein